MSGYPFGAAYAKDAPFNLPRHDSKVQRELERQAQLAACDGFDEGDSHTSSWLADVSDDIRSVVMAAANVVRRPSDTDALLELERCHERLRERYVRENMEVYFQDEPEPDSEPDYE